MTETKRGYDPEIDKQMSFEDILESSGQIKTNILVSWENGLKNIDESCLTDSEIEAVDEIRIFLIRLKRFIKQKYLAAYSDFLNELLGLIPEEKVHTTEISKTLALNDIQKQAKSYSNIIFFSWRTSIQLMHDDTTSLEDQKTRDETFKFLEVFENFLIDEYEKAKTTILSDLLSS